MKSASEEKVEVFASMLSATYAAIDNESDFDIVHKNAVNKFVKNFLEKIPNDFLPFSTYEIVKAIKKIKISSSPGEDQVHNIYLKYIPYEYVGKILKFLVNKSIETGIPIEWKIAKIIMIPKGESSSDPEKFRPISLTRCLGKLIERLSI